MKRTKASAKRYTEEESTSRVVQRGKKWDKTDASHYARMKNVAVPATQLASTNAMSILGIKEDVEGLFQNAGLGQLCLLHEKTYPDLVRQFMASAYVTYKNDPQEGGFLAFVVEKVYFEITFDELCDIFGLSRGERTSGLYWTDPMADFWQLIGTGIYGSPQSKESLIRSPVLRYAVRLIGSLLYGTTTSSSVTQWELILLYQGVRHLLPAFATHTFPHASGFNMAAVLAENLSAFKGKLTKGKSRACGFGAVITRILRHLEFSLDDHEPALTRSNNIEWNFLDIASLVSKEFIAGPYSTIRGKGPQVYIFQDRERRRLYCELPCIGQTALLSADAVEFLPPPHALTHKPSFFKPKYVDRTAASSHQQPAESAQAAPEDEPAQEEAAQEDEPQPYQLLPTDSSEYILPDMPLNATKREQQQWRDTSIKKNNAMLHKIWAAISRIRPCVCRRDDTVPREAPASSSSSGSSGVRRPGKRSKRHDDVGTSGPADDE